MLRLILHALLGWHKWDEGVYMKRCRYCKAYEWYNR